jgi:hypothetical protein
MDVYATVPPYPANEINAPACQLPDYSAQAAADERVVLIQPIPSRSSALVPVKYLLNSSRLEISISAKNYPVKVIFDLHWGDNY